MNNKTLADVNRFSARFRAAAAFEGAKLKEFGDDTTKGYSGIIKVFLAFCAAESYAVLWSEEREKHRFLKQLTGPSVQPELEILGERFSELEELRNALGETITAPELNSSFDNFKADSPGCYYDVARIIRNAFGHGILTPNLAVGRPLFIADFCMKLSEMLLCMVDRDFSQRVNQLQAGCK